MSASGQITRPTAIRGLVLDIDGVLTDGTDAVGGLAEKRLFLRDLDALTQARRRGVTVAFLSGEPEIEAVVERCGGGAFLAGCKDKGRGLREVCDRLGLAPAEVCYVGDADRDVPALEQAGLGLAPADASPAARSAADRVLRAASGRGAVAEAVELIWDLARLDALEQAARAASAATVEALAAVLAASSGMADVVAALAVAIADALARGGSVVTFGNGGSAAMAEHAAAELVGRFRTADEPLRALALSAGSPVVTALANDFGFNEIFARQVAAVVRPGDIVVGFSTSGRSPNVVRGLEEARRRGARTVGFTGQDPRDVGLACDLVYAAPSSDTPRIQEMHLVIWHAACEALETTRRNRQA